MGKIVDWLKERINSLKFIDSVTEEPNGEIALTTADRDLLKKAEVMTADVKRQESRFNYDVKNGKSQFRVEEKQSDASKEKRSSKKEIQKSQEERSDDGR